MVPVRPPVKRFLSGRITRDGMHSARGRRLVAGLARAVKPRFMLPPVGLSIAGGLAAPSLSVPRAAAHAVAVASALYTAHLVDEYVDAHRRGEEAPRLSIPAIAVAGAVSTAVFGLLVAWLWLAAGPRAALLTLPLWVLAALHAPLLDGHPITATIGYPVGVALALGGGAVVQGPLGPGLATVAALLVPTLAGAKISIDRLDVDFDRSIGKRTVPVVVGATRSRYWAAGCHGVAALGLLAAVGIGWLPIVALGGLFGPVGNAVAARWVGEIWSIRLQMAVTYPFTVTLLAAHCLGAGCAGLTILQF